jgi:hypothetical protein
VFIYDNEKAGQVKTYLTYKELRKRNESSKTYSGKRWFIIFRQDTEKP